MSLIVYTELILYSTVWLAGWLAEVDEARLECDQGCGLGGGNSEQANLDCND